MPDLAALEVKLGYEETGKRWLYPDFNLVPVVSASNMDWKDYVDRGPNLGWFYEVCSDHQLDDPEIRSPVCHRLGMLIVDPVFCAESEQLFSDCIYYTEAEAQDFYDSRYMIKSDTEDIDVGSIQATYVQGQACEWLLGFGADTEISARLEEIKTKLRRVLLLDDPMPGARNSDVGSWQSLKTRFKINYIEPPGGSRLNA